MKCKKCDAVYEGNFCPICGESNGELTGQELQPLNPVKPPKKLFGFRSGKIINKIISVCYMIFCGLYLLGVLTTEKYANISGSDFIISQICDGLIFVMMITPYIFFSNFKFREKLPLFKKHTVKWNIIGLLIVIAVLGIISGILDANHSEEFLADRDNHDWKETVTEATCDEVGEKIKQCQYCGIKEIEEIPKLNHENEEVSRSEPTCDKDGEVVFKCNLCTKEFTEVLEVTGHKFKEISRKDATETTEGEIVRECSVCKKQETTITEKLKGQENSKTVTSKNVSSGNVSFNKTSSKTENSSKNQSSEPSATSSENTVSKTPEQLRYEYTFECIPLDYDSILRDPEAFKNVKCTYQGKFIGEYSELFGDEQGYIIKIDCDEYGRWRHPVYVSYIAKADDVKLLKGDAVQVFGECKGVYTPWGYDTMPYIDAEYIDIIDYRD